MTNRCRFFYPPTRESNLHVDSWRSRWVTLDSDGIMIEADDPIEYKLHDANDVRRLRDDAAAECSDTDVMEWLSREYMTALRGDDPERLLVTARALQLAARALELEGHDDAT